MNKWKMTRRSGMVWTLENAQDGLKVLWDIKEHHCKAFRDEEWLEMQTTPRSTLPCYLGYLERNYGRA